MEHFNPRVYYSSSPLTMVISLIVMATAGYLCWNCNAKEDKAARIIYTVFATIFGYIYLIYYFIYRILMGRKCPN